MSDDEPSTGFSFEGEKKTKDVKCNLVNVTSYNVTETTLRWTDDDLEECHRTHCDPFPEAQGMDEIMRAENFLHVFCNRICGVV